MANNFKIIISGAIYVSKSGNDSTGSGTANSPYLTVSKALSIIGSINGNIVIGAGFYQENVYIASTGSNTYINIYGDGDVELNGSSIGGTAISIGGNNSTGTSKTVNLFNLRIIGYSILFGTGGTNTPNYYYTLTNCMIQDMVTFVQSDNGGTSGQQFITSAIGSIILNTIGFKYGASNVIISKNTFINSYCVASSNTNIPMSSLMIINSYFDTLSNITVPTSGIPIVFNNCNILSIVNGVSASSYAGSHPGILTQLYTESPSTAFNQITTYDYTLKSTSTLKNAGTDGQQIGCEPVSSSFDGNSSSQIVDQSNVTINGNGDVILTSPATSGYITFQIDLGSISIIRRIKMFRSDSRPLETIDYDNTSTNPNRLIYEMRWANTTGALSSATFKVFEWNTQPTLDASNVPNGDPTFNPSTQNNITARYIEVRATLRNDGIGG